LFGLRRWTDYLVFLGRMEATDERLDLLSGLYMILAAIVAYGFGGYLAGRARAWIAGGTAEEIEFRDGTHGLMVWALATLLTGFLAIGAVQSLTRSASSGFLAGENIIAYDLTGCPPDRRGEAG
jgi:hypothetical protein